MPPVDTQNPLGDVVDAAPAQRPTRVTICGSHVDLVPFDATAHGPALYAAAHGAQKEAIWAYLPNGPYEDPAAFDAHYQAAALRDDPLMFAIIDKATGVAVGHATYLRIDPANRTIEVGHILYTPALMRTPGGTEAMYLMARHAFEDLGYRRYEWKCNALNAPSRRAALRYGFRFEGLFRHHMIVKGRNRDTAWFAMLEEEWPQIAVAFENWLAPANFDAEGRQVVPLGLLNAERLEVGTRTLRRASLADRAAVEAVQQGAYARNRLLLGVEPVPLLWDYARVFREREVWVLDSASGAPGLDGVLILHNRADDLLTDSLAVAPQAQAGGVGNLLLAAGEARARALGRRMVRLYTGEPLSANIHWYRRKGYSIERVEQLPDRRLVHLAKALD
ncbi:RimJ/RimL family protein N-acetyltransferase [Angulomicrobium tetraedrale]|uniref:RimJ/RimL family protein N-acetyltransferase n=1 Tax=Ancylobacter tetraedralis TaxID=217068 RepID=A0A839ZC51_9HYPH|nr:GNAT family N-acetyltransferase [Ancylobacter tetraedralis]MBB3772324.1 RimJ/RimL family protein N-acetyltransferase [Ancylobacter tetraedralis]